MGLWSWEEAAYFLTEIKMVPYPFVMEDVPVFRKRDVDWFGLPELYGIEKYRVIEDVTFGDSYDSGRSLVPIHRYDRLQRFASIVRKLLGQGPPVPERVLRGINWVDDRKEYVWNDIRFQLKMMGESRWYNSIPEIIAYFEYPLKMRTEGIDLKGVFDQFQKMSWKFDHIEWPERRYFPNLRYIAFRLFEMHGVEFEYHIPILQTPRKFPVLNEVWEKLTE